MAKTLDFNKLNRPTLQLVMCDEDKTVINVTTPHEALIEELAANLDEFQSIIKSEDEEAVKACYGLAARLISYNTADMEVSVEDLRGKYWPAERIANQLYLMAFFGAYVDFIKEINNAKN